MPQISQMGVQQGQGGFLCNLMPQISQTGVDTHKAGFRAIDAADFAEGGQQGQGGFPCRRFRRGGFNWDMVGFRAADFAGASATRTGLVFIEFDAADSLVKSKMQICAICGKKVTTQSSSFFI